LTELGESFSKPLVALVDWAARNHEAIKQSRVEFDGALAA
jgi:DNA-binding HxlR family transcriptional regulator